MTKGLQMTIKNKKRWEHNTQGKASYLPQLVEEDILSIPPPCALSSHDQQYEPQDPPKFHPALLYGLLNLDNHKS